MKPQLRHKIIGLALISALIPSILLTLFLVTQEEPMLNDVNDELTNLISESLDRTVENVYASYETADSLIENWVEHSLKVAQHILGEAGKVSMSTETVSWVIKNQYASEDETVLALPKMMVGDNWLGQNTSFATQTPVVDKVKSLVGGTVTIFQKINQNGDMLRVATNVQSPNFDRAIGTYIPALHPDGTQDEVISTLLRGERYTGSAYVVDGWYMTAYDPIKNGNDEVIGAIYVGVRQRNIETLQNAISDISVGEDGFVWVMKRSDSDLETSIVVHSESVEINDIINEKSKSYYERIREEALTLKDKEIGTERFSWIDPSENVESDKTIKFMYFEPWDWIIGLTAYKRDYISAFNQVATLFDRLILGLSIGAIATFIIVGLIAFYFGSQIAKPISAITTIATQVADGNISAAAGLIESIDYEHDRVLSNAKASDDETGKLFQAITVMIDSLNSLIGQVKRSSIELISTATEISGTSKVQERTVNDFGASTNEIAAAVKEISSTSQELYKTMINVSDVAHETGTMADAGISELTGMEVTMKNLTDATTSISSKLSVITEKAGNINSVVTTISKVADQTNLLSLNAAIEAEKAGEYGVGFAVVAREIRRLADQTAVATLDIEQMVKEMQAAVSAGVMEMDKFTEEVRSGVDEVGRISGHLEKIIVQVQELTPRFEAVKGGMQSQSQGAQQINDAMVSLTDGAQRTSNALNEFDRATKALHKAVDGLRKEVSRFKISHKVFTGNTRHPFAPEPEGNNNKEDGKKA